MSNKKITTKKKREIFEKVLVDFSFIGFHKDLDKALAKFIEEKVTYENKKTLIDYTIMDFCSWVTEKKNGHMINNMLRKHAIKK